MGGTWVWLNDSRFADNQVLLRDGTVLRRIVPSGSYEILNPRRDIYHNQNAES